MAKIFGAGGSSASLDSPVFYGMTSAVLVTVLSLIFFFRYDVQFLLVVCVFPLSFFPGVVLSVLERYLKNMQVRIEAFTGRVQAAFLILFAYLIVYIVVFTLVLVYPIGLLPEVFAEETIGDQYELWIINLAIVASLACWFRCQIAFRSR